MKRTLLCSALCLLWTPAHALTCVEVDQIIKDVHTAETKAAVASALVRAGMPQTVADNFELVIPDVEDAQKYALHALAFRKTEVCSGTTPE